MEGAPSTPANPQYPPQSVSSYSAQGGLYPTPPTEHQVSVLPPYQGAPIVTAPPVMVQPAVTYNVINATLLDVPGQAICPKCNQQVLTDTTPVSGALTWISCSLIAFCGGILGCCCIPFCLNRCKDVRHTCPHCQQLLFIYKRM
ncbi:LITAF domain-containing protein-like [Erpetoichthys calabaricus]|uniref:LITAF domain-containing protein-like n=1 Tax=Erpetoichthys calabaricus TaxID=27687 RepID=UPI002234A4AF|nr:LITAF domain-containing protein-like [Erpetoichthys calabaricus]